MFGDKMNQADQVMMKLECAHEYTNGEMRCIHCSVAFKPQLDVVGVSITDQEYTEEAATDI